MKTFDKAREKPNTFYYVTSVVFNRIPVFRDSPACEALVSVFDEVRKLFPYKLIAYVIMPDHFHVVVNLIDGDISKWLMRVRGNSARKLIDGLRTDPLLNSLTLDFAQKRNHKFALWQKDPSIVDLESHKFLLQKTGYIHANPVRAGLIDHPAKWKWSSYHALLARNKGDFPIAVDLKPYWTDEELNDYGR